MSEKKPNYVLERNYLQVCEERERFYLQVRVGAPPLRALLEQRVKLAKLTAGEEE